MKITSAEFIKGIRGTDPILGEKIPQIAFIGRSNVGKSSLMNCLLNTQKLVKSGKTPGKTKQINFFLIDKKIYFVDLPGYGFSKLKFNERDQIGKMLQWYFMEPVFSRKAVLVLDTNLGKPSELDLEMQRILKKNKQEMIVVANKIDALTQKERYAKLKTIAEFFSGTPITPCSAKTGFGKEEIWGRILEK